MISLRGLSYISSASFYRFRMVYNWSCAMAYSLEGDFVCNTCSISRRLGSLMSEINYEVVPSAFSDSLLLHSPLLGLPSLHVAINGRRIPYGTTRPQVYMQATQGGPHSHPQTGPPHEPGRPWTYPRSQTRFERITVRSFTFPGRHPQFSNGSPTRSQEEQRGLGFLAHILGAPLQGVISSPCRQRSLPWSFW